MGELVVSIRAAEQQEKKRQADLRMEVTVNREISLQNNEILQKSIGNHIDKRFALFIWVLELELAN